MAVLWVDGAALADGAAWAIDMRRLALPWAAQATAWLLTQIIPSVTEALAEASARARVAGLRAARARLEAEWSLEADQP